VPPGAVAVIVHGLAEHGGRHARVVQNRNELTAGVFRLDNRGRGRSGGQRGSVDVFRQFTDGAEDKRIGIYEGFSAGFSTRREKTGCWKTSVSG